MGRNQTIDEIGESNLNPNPLNKKHLLGCLIIILLLVISSAAVAGIFWWQKSMPNKKSQSIFLINSTSNTNSGALWEKKIEKIWGPDTDGDLLSDAEEKIWGTDIKKADTDGDGRNDFFEVYTKSNPLGDGKLDPDLEKRAVKKIQELTFKSLREYYNSRDCEQISFEDKDLDLPGYLTEAEIKEMKENARKNCYQMKEVVNKAKDYKDLSIRECQTLSAHFIDDCYLSLVEEEFNDASICQKIKNKSLKDECLSKIEETH